MARDDEKTFLIELYVPRLNEQTAAAIASRCRGAADELTEQGVTLRWLRSFAVIADETYLCVVAARDRDHVVQLSRLAGLEHDHVVEVVSIEGTPS